MSRQTYGGDVEWLVINDGDPYTCRCGQNQVMRIPQCGGGHSLCENLLEGLARATAKKVLVVEDDDWYAVDYVARMVAALEEAELVGAMPENYFNVRSRRWCRIHSNWHASLAATGLRGPAIEALREVASRGKPLMDKALWRQWGGSRPTGALLNEVLHVGIKGMPGTAGIGMGHRDSMGRPDPGLEVLKDWIGKDVECYEPFCGSPDH